MNERSIPVLVDSVKIVGGFRMARAAYFYVEATGPLVELTIGEQTLADRILPLGFTGLIHRPNSELEEFGSPELFDQLFRDVEARGPMYVESDDIWIPISLFSQTPARGDIFRVPYRLFMQLYPHGKDDVSLNIAEEDVEQWVGLVQHSKGETEAYSAWTTQVIRRARESYPSRESLALDWKE
jgi:hypothetical protein